MNKINNKKITYSLILLAFLAFILPTQGFAKACSEGGCNYVFSNYSEPAPSQTVEKQLVNPSPVITSINPGSSAKGLGTKTITIKGSGFIPSSVARMNGYDRTTVFIDSSNLLMKLTETDLYRDTSFFVTVFNRGPGGGYSNAATFTIYKAVGSPSASVQKKNSGTASGTVIVNDTPDTFYEIPGEQGAGSEVSNLAGNAIFGSNGFMPSGLIQWILFAIVVLLIVILIRKVFGAEERYHATPLKHS